VALMGDVRDWGAFIRGRWDWTRHGYEKGFPRSCQFSDLDAVVEFDGKRLLIEAKSYDGQGIIPKPEGGQLYLLRSEAGLGRTVLIVYGCGVCNDPYAIHQIYPRHPDRFEDWRGFEKQERRKLLKEEIDKAMGLRLCRGSDLTIHSTLTPKFSRQGTRR
jgi:hypothetical protein